MCGLVALSIFYGVNNMSHKILPKWIDILIGFPLSMYLIYKWMFFCDDLREALAKEVL